MKSKTIEVYVGLFVIAAIVALLILAFKVSGLTVYTHQDSYIISAEFSNIGDLKIRAPVTIAGVRVGQVADIILDKSSYKASVKMKIMGANNNIPVDSSANIVTAGLLGANYVSIIPGFEDEFLKDNGSIEDTQPALQIETMIGQLLFNVSKEDKGA